MAAAIPAWKRLALAAYCHATGPYRRVRNARAASIGRAPIFALFYHRIADDKATPWTLSNATFRREVAWLKRRFDLVSLAEAQARIGSGFNARPAVHITFDDGYSDNCRQALPLLIAERIPCTYFVSTRFVFEGLPFPHDLAAGFNLQPNSLDELRGLATAGIEIGAHTRTHADLGRIADTSRLRDEVVTAAQELQIAIGRPVRYFAFPFGQHANLNAEAFDLARQAGYEAVCSAYGGYNLPGDDPFHIQRMHGDELVRLKNWLTLDPWKRQPQRFPYDRGSAALEPGVVPA